MARMTRSHDEDGLPPRRGDAEIAAAVGDDPDQTPTRTEAELEAARAGEGEHDTYGVLRLCRRLGLIDFVNRHQIPLGTLWNWEQGPAEPDRSAKVLLAAIAADPEGVARAAEHAGDPAWLAAGPCRLSRMPRARPVKGKERRGGLTSDLLYGYLVVLRSAARQATPDATRLISI
jgi:DNA-binding transcriptional regulator YiaG